MLLGHQPVRVNLERCLGHRYQEDERHPEKGRHVVFGDDVEELCAMRLPPPDTAAQSPLRRACAAAYAACSDEAVRGQAAALLREGPGGGAAAVRAALAVAAAADDAPLLGRLERRLEYLRQLVALEARPGAPLPLSRAVVRVDAAGGDAPPAPRDGHTATPLPWRTNSCLVFGGHGDAEAYFDGFHELNLETRRWARLQVAGPGRPSPSPRHSHTAAAVGDFVLVYGGVGGLHHGGYLGDLSVLHVGVEGRVAALAVARAPGGDGGAAAPPPRGRHAAATALVRSGDSGALLHMYVYGGHDGRGKLDDLWRAEVAVGPADGCAAAVRWERLALPPAGQPPAMHRHALCLHAGRLLLFGGAWGGDSFATLWALDLAHPGRGFDARPTRDRGECGPLGQAGHCYVHDADAGRVYVVGGGSMHSSKGRASENFGRSPMRGRPGAGRKVRTFERVSMLDLNSAAWSVMRLEAPVGPANGYAAAIAACTSPAACVTQGGLLVHGGQNDAGKRRADTFLLVPRPLAR